MGSVAGRQQASAASHAEPCRTRRAVSGAVANPQPYWWVGPGGAVWSVLPSGGRLIGRALALAGGDASASQAARSTDVAAVVVPILFLVLLSLGVGFAILYTKHRRLQSSFTAFANSHYSSRLGSAIFSSGDDLGKWGRGYWLFLPGWTHAMPVS